MVSQSIPKSIFKTHVTIAIFLYKTIAFIITVLNIKTSGYRQIAGGGLLRNWAGKGSKQKNSNFDIQISGFGFLLTNQEVANKKWSTTEGISAHST